MTAYEMTAHDPTAGSREPLLDPVLFARGMALIRIFFGVILFANGLAKIEPSFGRVDLGPYHANLITREGSRGILNFEVNERTAPGATVPGTEVPGLKTFVNDVVLDRWDSFQWVVVATELGAGALLILGLATRFAALVGLGQQLFLALVYASSNRWMFEQPHEYVPLIVLALVPAGRAWGVDAWLVRRARALHRWPF